MHVHNLYADESGETHWRDIDIPWTEEGLDSKLSECFPATGIIFRQVPGDYDFDWHRAPRRQYCINLDAGVRLEARDGESRIIGAGEVFLLEDTTGKGHYSTAVDGKVRNCIFVTLE